MSKLKNSFSTNFSTFMRLQCFRFKDDKSIKRQIRKKSLVKNSNLRIHNGIFEHAQKFLQISINDKNFRHFPKK